MHIVIGQRFLRSSVFCADGSPDTVQWQKKGYRNKCPDTPILCGFDELLVGRQQRRLVARNPRLVGAEDAQMQLAFLD